MTSLKYQLGCDEPNHPLPVLPLEVRYYPWTAHHSMHNSIVIEEHSLLCPCCGGIQRYMVAIFDFNFDRCMDYHFPVGCYVNARQMDEGITAYQEEQERSGHA